MSTFSAVNRINALPTSDTLRLRKDDVDCSGSDFASIPEDGQFVIAPAVTAKNGCSGGAIAATVLRADETTASGVFANQAHTGLLAGATFGGGLAMIYSGGAARSDLSGLGYTRVPVVRGAARFKCKLFNLPSSGLPSADYHPGQYVTVDVCSTAVQGDANRLVLTPCSPTAASWAVGRVSSVSVDSPVSGTGELEIELFERPVIFNPSNVSNA